MQLTTLLGSALVVLGLAALVIPARHPWGQSPPPLLSGQTIRVLLSFKLEASSFESQHIFPALELTPLGDTIRVNSGPDASHLSLAFSALPQRPLRFTVQDGVLSATSDGQTYRLGPAVQLEPLLPETAAKVRYRILSTSRDSPATHPEYPGKLWLSLLQGGILLVNEVDMQDYLRRVLPSEMPVFFHPQALAAQAIAARTYAYSRMIAPPEHNFWKQFGADVDDSVNEQVYNNTSTTPASDAAVEATRGQILTFAGQPVQAFFFSTSPGSTASIEQVWPDRPAQPYLKGQTQAYPVPVVIADETTALAFFQNWSRSGYYDGASSLFRWKVTLSRTELEAILAKTLPAVFQNSPDFTQTPEGATSPDSADFKLGSLQNLVVTQRTPGGFVTELEVDTSSGRYLVRRESNIRTLIRPNKAFTGQDVVLERISGAKSLNFGALPSAAFALEATRDTSGALQSLTFWGGGYGHGVGMSQYGADQLGKMGQTYPQILAHFYPGSSLTTLSPPVPNTRR